MRPEGRRYEPRCLACHLPEAVDERAGCAPAAKAACVGNRLALGEQDHCVEDRANEGSLVAGYQAAFLTATGIILIAILIVVIQMRTRTAERH
jgi:hypothetical protein